MTTNTQFFNATNSVTVEKRDFVVVQRPMERVVVSAGYAGQRGNDGIGADTCLQISLRLAEFATPEAKAQARENLDLDVIDAGTFF